jgi:hypothetical protein
MVDSGREMNVVTGKVRAVTGSVEANPLRLATVTGEACLRDPLMSWLSRVRRINSRSRVAFELPWLGRWVDLATLTSSGRTAAYELKLGSLGRALEQAAYNRLAFDRSYIVTASVPRPSNLELAAVEAVGVIVVQGEYVDCLLDSPLRRPLPEVRRRLLTRLRTAGEILV